MRILFLTTRFPGQLTRGDQLRAFEQIRALAPRHAITLLSFEAAPDAGTLARMQSLCAQVLIVPRSRLGMAWSGLRAWLRGQALQSGLHSGGQSRAVLKRLLAGDRFDLAHVQLVRLAPLVSQLAPLPCVLDLVDALSLNMARRARLDGGPLAWIAGLEAARLTRLERQLCTEATLACVCSEADRVAIGPIERLHVIDNGVDLERFACLLPQQREPDAAASLVFVGNLGYFPNVDAIRWFAAEVLPLLDPNLRLRLVGARPATMLRRLAAQHTQLELVGEVPEVLPYLHAATVALVPLRGGSGQQLKLLEAMASGTPVVACSLPAAAIGALDSEHLLRADSPQDMAKAIQRLVSSPELRQQLALRARELVEQRFSWSRSAAMLEQLWLRAAHG